MVSEDDIENILALLIYFLPTMLVKFWQKQSLKIDLAPHLKYELQEASVYCLSLCE